MADRSVREEEAVTAKGKASGSAAEKDDFKFIVRMVNTDIDGERSVLVGLTKIKGIGIRSAQLIARRLGISPHTKLGTLDDQTIATLEQAVLKHMEHAPGWMANRQNDWETGEDLHLVGVDVDLSQRDDINRMRMIRCYKGIRHERGQKVRGQRTKANGRTGLQMGVIRKKGVAAQATSQQSGTKG